MTYEEIVRRVNMKSSICPECGCFISSLLDCCPACEYSTSTSASTSRLNDSYCSADEFAERLRQLNTASAVCTANELRDHYASMGGNAATENRICNISRTLYDRMSFDESLDKNTIYCIDSDVASEMYERCATPIMRVIGSASDLHNLRGDPGQLVYVADTCNIYTCNTDYLWVQIYNPEVCYSDVGRPVTLYKDNEPFITKYVPDTDYTDYTSYYKAKSDALKYQQHTIQLYKEAIKAMKSYSGDKEEEKEYVYHYPF